MGNFCKHCNQLIKLRKQFCSRSCCGQFKLAQSIQAWLNGEVVGHTGLSIKIKPFVRDYLIGKADYKCSKCGWNKRHPITNRVPLEINHIDGNPKHSTIGNLEVLCPNCHSLTLNFRNLNANSPRKRIIS